MKYLLETGENISHLNETTQVFNTLKSGIAAYDKLPKVKAIRLIEFCSNNPATHRQFDENNGGEVFMYSCDLAGYGGKFGARTQTDLFKQIKSQFEEFNFGLNDIRRDCIEFLLFNTDDYTEVMIVNLNKFLPKKMKATKKHLEALIEK